MTSSSDLPSLYSPSYTMSLSKLSCSSDFYYAHLTFAYLVMVAGFGCLITRVVTPLKWMHVWFGRLYWMFMLWCTGTSLLIHNTGLPLSVLLSFLFVAGGMCLGWLFISFHQIHMSSLASKRVEERIRVEGADVVARFGSLERMIAAEKAKVAEERGFWERIVSWKAAHGALMFTSFINIIGRIFATRPTSAFTCHTHPFYKPFFLPNATSAASSSIWTPVPELDPEYARLPWAKTGLTGWGVALSVGPFVGGLLVGAVYVAVERALRRRKGAASVVSKDSREDKAQVQEEGKLVGGGEGERS